MSETEPTIRVMALRAPAYCERLFYLEEFEEITLRTRRCTQGTDSMKN